ncbi:MAG: sugar phosphate isomerase/epimerase family protein [bacterium]
MKLSLQEGLYTAQDFKWFLRDAKDWGFDAVEVWGEGLDERLDEVVRTLKEENVVASSVCPGGGGIRGSILSDSMEERATAEADIAGLIECCAKLGGAGLVLVPEFGVKKFMRLYPDHGDFESRKKMFAERLEMLAQRAERLGVKILLEPLNRYESFFLLTVGQGAELCRMSGSKAVRVMADLFHMGIEEDNLIGAIEANGEWISHVHIVDTNRKLPGQGDRDFAAIFKALKKAGFDGYLCYECGIVGKAANEVPLSVAMMRKIMTEI